MAEVVLDKVWKIYGKRVEAVKELNLHIKDGEFVGFPASENIPVPNRNLSAQRGLHFPPPKGIDPVAAQGITDRWEADKK